MIADNLVRAHSESTDIRLPLCNRDHTVPILGSLATRPRRLLEFDVCYACYPGGDLLLCIRMVVFDNCICTPP